MIDVLPASATPLDAAETTRAQVRRLYALIYSRVGNREAAERLTNTAVTTALRRLDATPPEHGVAAWLDRAARNAATDYWRGDSGWPAVQSAHEEMTYTHPRDVAATCQEHAAGHAQALLDRLPATDRAVLFHRIVEGLSVTETARRLGIGEAQVKVVQHRALSHATRLRMDEVTATQQIGKGTKDDDHDAPTHARPILCRVTAT